MADSLSATAMVSHSILCRMLSSTTGEFQDLFQAIYQFGRPLQARGMADGLSTSPLNSKGSWSRVLLI